MKINFYDEIRQMIKQELGLGTEDIKKLVADEIKQVVRSMVDNAVLQIGKGAYDIDKLVKDEIRFRLQDWNTRDYIRQCIKDNVSEMLVNIITVKVEQD